MLSKYCVKCIELGGEYIKKQSAQFYFSPFIFSQAGNL